MTVKELAGRLELKSLAGESGLEREIQGCYIGDLLSWVMARASAGDVWITVMGNVNAIAVAALTDCACIVLTEAAELDADAKARADQQAIPVFSTEKDSFETAVKVAGLLP